MRDRTILAVLIFALTLIVLLVGFVFLWNESGDSELDHATQEIADGRVVTPSRHRNEESSKPATSQPTVDLVVGPNSRESEDKDQETRARILVKVFNQLSNQPIQGLGVSLSRVGMLGDKKFVSKHRTNDKGEFELANLKAGAYLLEAIGLSGHQRFVVVAGQDQIVNFGILKSVSFSGRCVDEMGKGVAGASIYISEYTFQPTLGSVMTKSDSKGYYRIAATDPGRFIQARKDGWSPSPLIKLGTEYGAKGLAPLRMKSKGAEIKGLLRSGLDTVSGSKITLTELDLGESETGQDGSISLETVSDEEGGFSFKGLALGKARLRIVGDSHANHELVVDLVVGLNQVTVELPAGGVVKGTAFDAEGKELSGVVIMVFPEQLENYLWTITKGDGSYAVNNVPPGPLRITARKSDEENAEIKVEHKDVMKADHDLEWNPRLILQNHVSGVVIFADTKEPIPYTQVIAIPLNIPAKKGLRHAQTDLNGRFHLQALLQDDHKLHLSVLPQDGTYTKFYAVDLPGLPLVRPGMADMVIEIPRSQIPNSFISGRVLGRDKDVPLDGLELRAHRLSHLSLKYPISTAEGSFHFGPIPAGDYVIELISSKLGSKVIPVRTIQSGKTLDLGRVVLDEPGFAIATHGAEHDAKSDTQYEVKASGRVVWSQSTRAREIRIGPLQPGEYTLHLKQNKSLRQQAFSISRGDQTAVTIAP